MGSGREGGGVNDKTICKFHLPIQTVNPLNGSHLHWKLAKGWRREQ